MGFGLVDRWSIVCATTQAHNYNPGRFVQSYFAKVQSKQSFNNLYLCLFWTSGRSGDGQYINMITSQCL